MWGAGRREALHKTLLLSYSYACLPQSYHGKYTVELFAFLCQADRAVPWEHQGHRGGCCC